MPVPVSSRPATVADLPAVIALNDAALPAVSAMPRADWERFLAVVPWFRVVDGPAGGLDAFIVVMTEGLDYASLNYRWFAARHPRFAYIDRVVVAAGARGRGLGQALYGEAIAFARAAGAPVLTAEVNRRPPNPGSLRFHARLGFQEAGTQETDGGRKAVVLLALPLPPLPPVGGGEGG